MIHSYTLNMTSLCMRHISSIPITEAIRLQIFEYPDWTVFPSTIWNDRDFRLLPWTSVWNFGTPLKTYLKAKGKTYMKATWKPIWKLCEILFENFAVVNIWSLIYYARGLWRDLFVYTWHDLIINLAHFIHIRDKIHSYTLDMTSLCTWYISSISMAESIRVHVTWFVHVCHYSIHIYDMIHSYTLYITSLCMWHISFIPITEENRTSHIWIFRYDTLHPYPWQDPFIHTWQDFSMYVIYSIHIYDTIYSHTRDMTRSWIVS